MSQKKIEQLFLRKLNKNQDANSGETFHVEEKNDGIFNFFYYCLLNNNL